jgi:pyridoxamine 5'-phosphate oxidase
MSEFEKNAPSDPIQRFQEWYKAASKIDKIDVDAIALATCSEDAIPSCRILYFRRLIGTSFCFFTNYLSHKGQDLGLNQWASAVFLWHMMGRQVRVEGKVRKLTAEESDEYFYQRALESQLSAATSKQSEGLSSYQKFLDEIEEKRAESQGKVKRPAHWGGYAIEPKKIEFWQMGDHRRHLRELYVRDGSKWQTSLLYP